MMKNNNCAHIIQNLKISIKKNVTNLKIIKIWNNLIKKMKKIIIKILNKKTILKIDLRI